MVSLASPLNSITSFLFNSPPNDEDTSGSEISAVTKIKSGVTNLFKQHFIPFQTTGRYLFGDLKNQKLHWDIALMDALYAIPTLRSAIRLVGAPLRTARNLGLMGAMISADGPLNRMNHALGMAEDLIAPWRDSVYFNLGMQGASIGTKILVDDFEGAVEHILQSGLFISSGYVLMGASSKSYHHDVSYKISELIKPAEYKGRRLLFVHPGFVRAHDYGAKGPLGRTIPTKKDVSPRYYISGRSTFDFRPDGDKAVPRASYKLWAKHMVEALRWFNHMRRNVPNNIPHLLGSGYGLGMLELHQAKLTIHGKPHVRSHGPTVMPGTHPANFLDHAILYISTYLSGEPMSVWPVSDQRLGAVLRFLSGGYFTMYPVVTVDRGKIRTPGFKENFLRKIQAAAKKRDEEKDFKAVHSIIIDFFSRGLATARANIGRLEKIVYGHLGSIEFTRQPRTIWASVTDGRRKPMLDSTGRALPFGMFGNGLKLKSGTAQIIEHLKETHDTVYLQGMAIDHNICPKNQPRSVAFSDEDLKSWKNKLLQRLAGSLPWPQEHLSGGTATVRFGRPRQIDDGLSIPGLRQAVTDEMLKVTQLREQVIIWLHHQYSLTHDLGLLLRFCDQLSPEFWGYIEYALTLNPRLKAENFKRTEAIRAITHAFTQASLRHITGTYLGSHSSRNIPDFEKTLLEQLKKILNLHQ